MAKLRRLTRRWITLAESRGSEGEASGLPALPGRESARGQQHGGKAWSVVKAFMALPRKVRNDRDINAARNIAKAAGLAVTACGAQIRPGLVPAPRSEAGTHRDGQPTVVGTLLGGERKSMRLQPHIGGAVGLAGVMPDGSVMTPASLELRTSARLRLRRASARFRSGRASARLPSPARHRRPCAPGPRWSW